MPASSVPAKEILDVDAKGRPAPRDRVRQGKGITGREVASRYREARPDLHLPATQLGRIGPDP